MHLESFDYELPESLIAKVPADRRDQSRLLVVDRSLAQNSHHRFSDIGRFLRPGDLLVRNNTRVLPARLFGQDFSSRQFEVLLLEPKGDPFSWICLARPGKKLKGETTLRFPENVSATIRRAGEGRFSISFAGFTSSAEFLSWVERVGALPLPPYIDRPMAPEDRERYQTVYAKDPGSVAAPTAGLHFTEELIRELENKGIEFAELTLNIGYGTFSPIRVENLDEHQMHEESYLIMEKTHQRLVRAKQEGRRIIAVGTTSLRALESINGSGLVGRTSLFIRPGYDFQWVDGLITNFHLPKSSLYILVSALLGLERTRATYMEAVREKYRFFSYGDAMLIA